MQNPANLRVAGQARALALTVYGATERFPAAERFGLTAQMRRAAISIGSNIAEGCGRFGNRELLRFLQIAFGSVCELEFQALIAIDLGLLTTEEGSALQRHIGTVKGMLACLITSHRSRSSR